MNTANRRLQGRRRMPRPALAELVLCDGATIVGAVVNEQLQGVGLVFTGSAAGRLLAHKDCCEGRTTDLRVEGDGDDWVPVPARVIHVTERASQPRICSAGVVMAADHLGPVEVGQLLRVWQRLEAVAEGR